MAIGFVAQYGSAYSGYILKFFEPGGTSTPKKAYADEAETDGTSFTTKALDASGFAKFYLKGKYYVQFTTSGGTEVWNIDNFRGTADISALDGWIDLGDTITGTPDFTSGLLTFELVGDQTANYPVGRRIKADGSTFSDAVGAVASSSFSTTTTITAYTTGGTPNSTMNSILVGPTKSLTSVNFTHVGYPVLSGETGVTNPEYYYGYFKRHGAVGDGSTDDTTAVTNADTSAAAIGVKLTAGRGSYKINVTGASITINTYIEFETGAKLVVFRTSGSNYLDLRGGFRASNDQIFDLSNVYTTKAQWDADWDVNAPTFPLFFGYGSTTYNQFDRVFIDYLCPQHFGAVGITGTDDTLEVQMVFDYHQPTKLVSSHDVSQVTLRGNELYIDFQIFKLLGNPSATDYSSVLEIKCGYSTLKNIRVDSNKSQYYQCAIHWYTNDLTTYYPGHNRIEGMYVENGYIDLCIGGLPSQTTFSNQAAVVTAPDAIDAPLSESVVFGFKGLTSLCNVLFNQPNGKVRFQDPAFATPSTAGFSAPSAGRSTLALANYSTVDVRYPGSDMSVTGGSLITTDTSDTIPAFTLQSGRLAFVNTDLELSTQGRIKSYTGTYAANGSTHAGQTYYIDSYLYLIGVSNFGYNGNIDEPVFVIEDKANGQITISDSRITFGSNYAQNRTAPVFMVTDTFSGLDAAATTAEIISASTELINPYIDLMFTNFQFRDAPWKSHSTELIGITRGLPNVKYINCGWVEMLALDTTAPADDPGLPSMTVSAKQGHSHITIPTIDPTGSTVASAVTTGSDGGWTVASTGAGQVSGVTVTDGPIVPGDDITDATPTRYNYLLRLESGADGAGATISITSPKIACEPNRAYVLSYFITTNEGTPAAKKHIARIKSYDFDDASLSDDDPITVDEDNISGNWQHVTAVGKTNKNAAKLALFFYCEDGAQVDITGITLQ